MSGATERGEPLRGWSFYDDETVFSNYSAHREWEANPNAMMEEPALLEVIGDVGGARVLDLGCGDAALGRMLFEAGCRSYRGIDASERMIARATEMLKGTFGTASFIAPPRTMSLSCNALGSG